MAAPYLSNKSGKRVYLKLETELPTGSFKVRGALYALTQRLKWGAVEEVVASSTGNHGAAVAYACVWRIVTRADFTASRLARVN